jgi:outer membrane protein TolC
MRYPSLAAARALVSIAVLLPMGSHAADPALTLTEAQRIAVERSRQLLAHDASIRSSREMAVAARQLPDPVLRLGIDNLPVEGADRFSLGRDFMTMRRIGVMQEFTGSEKRRLRSARFEREADRAVAEKNATLAGVQRDTAMAWLDVLYLERVRALVGEEAQEIRLEIEAAESAYRAGRSSSQADVLAAQSSRVLLEDRLTILDRRIRNARVMLSRWVGDKAGKLALAGEPPLDTVPIHLHALEEQLRRHPTIAAMSEEVAMLQAEAALAQANKRPDWTWEVMYQKRGSDFSDMIGVGVSIPLQWDQQNRQDRELASKLALAENAQAQRDEALRAHLAEVQTMLNEWQNGKERLRRYERELLPLARVRRQALVSAYRGGKDELSAVLAARRNELEVRTQLLEIEADTARTWAQLRYLYPDESLPLPAVSSSTASRSNLGVAE